MKTTDIIKKMLEDGSKKKNPLKVFDQTKTIPLYTPLYKLVLFAETAKEIKANIKKSNNPRVIVLESWLILDFCVRDLILSGLELKRFQTEKFDILPLSFKGCLDLLHNLRSDQLTRASNPRRNFVSLPGEFFKFFFDNYDEEFESFTKVEYEYYRKVYPAGLTSESVNHLDNPTYRNVADGWIDIVKNLDNKWFKNAQQLNLCRNATAHDLDLDNTFKRFGINGPTKKAKIKLLKDRCIDLLNQLIGIRT